MGKERGIPKQKFLENKKIENVLGNKKRIFASLTGVFQN